MLAGGLISKFREIQDVLIKEKCGSQKRHEARIQFYSKDLKLIIFVSWFKVFSKGFLQSSAYIKLIIISYNSYKSVLMNTFCWVICS